MSVELAERSAEYIASDYCFSCAYFRQSKGHFGICADMGSKVPYDGTKQGSACGGWRVKSDWTDIPFKLQAPPERTKHKLVRATNIWWKKAALGSVTEFPLEAQKRIWAYDRQQESAHRKKLTDFALTVYESGASLRETAKRLNEKFETKTNSTTIFRWINRFRPEIRRPQPKKQIRIVSIKPLFFQPLLPCDRCGSSNSRRNGSSHGLQEYRCKDCGHRFREKRDFKGFHYDEHTIKYAIELVAQGYSLRAACKQIERTMHQPITSSRVCYWVSRFRPELDLAKRRQIGYHHTSAEQKTLLRQRVLEHNARDLPDCKCAYHRAHKLTMIVR